MPTKIEVVNGCKEKEYEVQVGDYIFLDNNDQVIRQIVGLHGQVKVLDVQYGTQGMHAGPRGTYYDSPQEAVDTYKKAFGDVIKVVPQEQVTITVNLEGVK